MESKEFKKLHKKLNKSQQQMAQLFGVSLETVQSYEQSWRNIPTHVERR
jgi:DNA-binding transcriptional regulator YiaG